MEDWSSLVGRRVLLGSHSSGRIYEVRIREVSPSGKFAKVCSSYDCYWIETGKYEILEVLDK